MCKYAFLLLQQNSQSTADRDQHTHVVAWENLSHGQTDIFYYI